MQPQDTKIRLAKALSNAGIASRRNAEKLILEEKISVNGEIIKDIVTFVTKEDEIKFQGKKIFLEQKPRLWIYNKPRGLVTTHNDPQNRPTVFDNFPVKYPHLISVGRLDIDSEGLLLITNSGDLARKLELPSNNYARVYKVKSYGKFKEEDLYKLESGPIIDGIKFKACKIRKIKSNNANHWFEITVFEGKNREVRRLFEYINMQVNRLIRTSYHKYKLGDLPKGHMKEIEI